MKSISPEPDTRQSALSPESAVRVLPDCLVVRQVRLVRRVGELRFVDSRPAAEIGDPVRTEETDSDRHEAERQQQRGCDEHTVGTTHLGTIDVTACCAVCLRRTTALRQAGRGVQASIRFDSLLLSSA